MYIISTCSFVLFRQKSFLSISSLCCHVFLLKDILGGGQRSKASKRHDAWLSNTVIVTKTMLVHVSKYTMLSFWLVLFCVELNAWSYFSSCYLKSSDFFYFAFQTLYCNKWNNSFTIYIILVEMDPFLFHCQCEVNPPVWPFTRVPANRTPIWVPFLCLFNCQGSRQVIWSRYDDKDMLLKSNLPVSLT